MQTRTRQFERFASDLYAVSFDFIEPARTVALTGHRISEVERICAQTRGVVRGRGLRRTSGLCKRYTEVGRTTLARVSDHDIGPGLVFWTGIGFASLASTFPAMSKALVGDLLTERPRRPAARCSASKAPERSPAAPNRVKRRRIDWAPNGGGVRHATRRGAGLTIC